jgi:CrcB protein
MWLYIAMGGALGAVSRYGVTLSAARLGATGFPYATLTVNVVGSFFNWPLCGVDWRTN